MYLVSVSSRTAVPVPAAAFDIRKGGTAMLAEQPQIISLTQLAVVAGCSRDHITQLYLHWTAGRYGQVYDDYHLNIDADGTVYRTSSSPSPCAAGWGRRPTTAMMPTWGSLPLRQCRPKKWRRQWRCS